MLFRSLDSNWDWKFGRGVNDYAYDARATGYDVKSKILSWYGDCFFAMNDGIDWKTIIGSKRQKDILDQQIKKILSNCDEIVDVTYFESEISDRSYHCVARFTTIYNETIEVKI